MSCEQLQLPPLSKKVHFVTFTSVEEYFYRRQQEMCMSRVCNLSTSTSADTALSTLHQNTMNEVCKMATILQVHVREVAFSSVPDPTAFPPTSLLHSRSGEVRILDSRNHTNVSHAHSPRAMCALRPPTYVQASFHEEPPGEAHHAG